MKELENLGNKAGVVHNTVKEVVQSLVDDALVETDKIGAGNFLWSLPSKNRHIRVVKLEELDYEIQELKTNRKLLNQQIQEELIQKPETETRLALIQQLEDLVLQNQVLKQEEQSLKGCSKDFFDEITQKAKTSVSNANVWTENIWNIKDWMIKRNPSLKESDINKHFGIPENLDDLEY